MFQVRSGIYIRGILADVDKNVTVAIPALRDVECTIEKVSWLRKTGFQGPIIASVNSWIGGGQSPQSIKDQFSLLGCEVYLHDLDMGLYGNFGFLLDKVLTSHFMWVALDDQPPENLWDSRWTPKLDADLTIGAINVTEFSSHGFGAVIERIDPGVFFSGNALRVHPAFIFGVWRTDFVRRFWPKHPMDWLDMFLLLCARTHGKVEIIDEVGPWILGHSNRSPHKVNGVFHTPFRWVWQVLRLYGFRVSPKQYLLLLRDFAGKVQFGLNELRESLKN